MDRADLFDAIHHVNRMVPEPPQFSTAIKHSMPVMTSAQIISAQMVHVLRPTGARSVMI